MGQSLFTVGLGISDDNISYLSGSAAPLGTTGDITFDAPIGSYYSEITSGATYKKVANNGNAADWTTQVAASELAALQAEVDRLELATGQNADGSFSAFTGTNFLNAATSLKDASVKLDAAIKANADNDAAEASARAAADTALDGRISQEVTDRSAADSALNSAITAEVTARTTADATEQAARIAADGVLQGQIDALVTSDTSLQTQITTEITNRTNADTAITTALTQEVTDRTAADTTLTTNLATEVTNRTNADTNLQNQINAINLSNTSNQAEVDAIEAAVGLNTDGTFATVTGSNYLNTSTSIADGLIKLDAQAKVVTDGLAAEIVRATGAEAAEASTRATADTSLSSAITTETGLRVAADSAEALARSTADAALQTEVDAVETSLGFVAADGTFVTIAGSNYLGAAASAKDAFLALDTQVKTNTVDIATLNTQFAGIDAALQAELDRLETATGVNVDGSFISFAGSNYLDSVSSVRAAVATLDGQLKLASDAIVNETALRTAADTAINVSIAAEATSRTNADAAIQAELDATQVGAGLNADGTYTAPVLSSYLASATSLKDADSKLDAAIKSVSDAVTALGTGSLTALQNALAQEVIDRTNGDASLNTALAAEITRATGAETTLTTNLAAEVTRATGVEATLNTAITNEVTRATTAEAAIVTSVTNEVTRATAAEGVLTTAIAAETTRAQGAESALSDEDSAIRAFVGKTAAGVEAPSYSSTTVVANGDNLKVAIGKLDAAVKSVVDGIQTVTVTDNVTAAAVVDSVETHGVGLVKWLVYVQTATAKQAVEVLATHDGSITVDATSATATTYAKLRMGAIAGLAFDVAVSGSGASQNMNLVVSSNVAVTVRTVRDVVSLA